MCGRCADEPGDSRLPNHGGQNGRKSAAGVRDRLVGAGFSAGVAPGAAPTSKSGISAAKKEADIAHARKEAKEQE